MDAGDRRGADDGQDEGVDPNGNALISQLKDEVAYLRDENRRKYEIIMQQAVTMRQLTASSQEPPEDAETVEETEPYSAAEEARDELGAERARREVAETTLHEGMSEERRRREEAERERDGLRRELFALRGREEAHEAAEEQQGKGPQSQSAAGGHQEGSRRPWWRRMIRG